MPTLQICLSINTGTRIASLLACIADDDHNDVIFAHYELFWDLASNFMQVTVFCSTR